MGIDRHVTIPFGRDLVEPNETVTISLLADKDFEPRALIVTKRTGRFFTMRSVTINGIVQSPFEHGPMLFDQPRMGQPGTIVPVDWKYVRRGDQIEFVVKNIGREPHVFDTVLVAKIRVDVADDTNAKHV